MNQIPDFSETELWVIRSTVNQRYGKAVALQLADSELRLDPSAAVLTTCPTVFWTERDANFVICKVGDGRYRSQFFYSIRDQYGTGREIYDDLAECVTVLLQVQSDHERDRAQGAEAGGPRDSD
ncbi:MAG: hypothetical protein M0Z84_06230 [Gammaproteobacteria bacterium]|nr:hypothetical protein [Gammaproteobacteria bacterium]